MPSEAVPRHVSALTPLVSGARVRLARESKGWNQTALAEHITSGGHGITPAAISQIERGVTTPSGRTLMAISEATRFPLDYFVGRPQDPDVPGFFRSLRSTPAYERKRALARAHMIHEFTEAIEHYIELPDLDMPEEFDLGLDDLADAEAGRAIEEAADRLRQRWGLGWGPIPNMVLELERHGALVCRLALGRAEVDAFSVRFSDRPVVVLSEDKRALTRSRFDAAHELGHLVLHRDALAGTSQAEKQAHRFAAAFLMPRRMVLDQLPSTAEWRRLFDLKAEWRVSVAALLMRARTLGKMSEARYTSAVKYMSARGWRTEEPAERELGPPEQPRLLSMAVDHLARDEGISIDDLAEEAHLPVDQISELLGRSATVGTAKPRLRL